MPSLRGDRGAPDGPPSPQEAKKTLLGKARCPEKSCQSAHALLVSDAFQEIAQAWHNLLKAIVLFDPGSSSASQSFAHLAIGKKSLQLLHPSIRGVGEESSLAGADHVEIGADWRRDGWQAACHVLNQFIRAFAFLPRGVLQRHDSYIAFGDPGCFGIRSPAHEFHIHVR